jgi:SAM-dependent methyltransferase
VAEILFRGQASYQAAQVAANKRKLRKVFACEEEVYAVADDARQYVKPQRGICHGARNGWEVKRLRELLGCDVQGTDIAPTAPNFGLIKLDYHVLPADWSDRFCFAFSNSLDHSHAPGIALSEWVRTLRPGGRLYVSHCANSERAQNLADCFGASLEEYEELIGSCCRFVKTIWLGNHRNPDGGVVKRLSVIVGQKERPKA